MGLPPPDPTATPIAGPRPTVQLNKWKLVLWVALIMTISGGLVAWGYILGGSDKQPSAVPSAPSSTTTTTIPATTTTTIPATTTTTIPATTTTTIPQQLSRYAAAAVARCRDSWILLGQRLANGIGSAGDDSDDFCIAARIQLLTDGTEVAFRTEISIVAALHAVGDAYELWIKGEFTELDGQRLDYQLLEYDGYIADTLGE